MKRLGIAATLTGKLKSESKCMDWRKYDFNRLHECRISHSIESISKEVIMTEFYILLVVLMAAYLMLSIHIFRRVFAQL